MKIQGLEHMVWSLVNIITMNSTAIATKIFCSKKKKKIILANISIPIDWAIAGKWCW